MSKQTIGRIERIVLTDDDYIEVYDAIGNTLRMPPNAARGLHRELGKFLATSNDAKPLPAPTRGDFKALQIRVDAIEKTLTDREDKTDSSKPVDETCLKCGGNGAHYSFCSVRVSESAPTKEKNK